MKHPFSFLTSIFLTALCAIGLTLSSASCANVFTEEDAKDIGSFLAKESLALASAKLSGQNVDLENAAHALGIQAAGMAAERITANLSQRAPDDVLDTALIAATHQLTQSQPDDPLVTTLAAQIATNAVEAAKTAEPALPSGTSAKTAVLVSP